MRPKDPSINGLRGVAVLAVMGCHLSKLCTQTHLWETDFWQGACGAHLLLIISGFAMAAVLYRSSSMADFFRSRLASVYPTYAFSIVISAGLIWLLNPPLYKVTWTQVLANLTMCQSWLGQSAIDDAWWLVGVLLKFYLLVGCAIFIRCNGKRVELAVFGYLAIVIAWRLQQELGIGLPDTVGRCINIQHAHLLISGMLLWCNREFGYSLPRCVGFLACIALEAVGTAMPWGSMVIIGLMLICFAREYVPLISGGVLTQIGRASHANYMIHGVLSYAMMKYLTMANVPIVVAMAVTVIGVIIVSELVTQYVAPWSNFIKPSADGEPTDGASAERDFEYNLAEQTDDLVRDMNQYVGPQEATPPRSVDQSTR